MSLKWLRSGERNAVIPTYVSIASAEVVNTTTETTILGAGKGSLVVLADTVTVGDMFAFRIAGIFSAMSNPSLRLRLFYGAVLIGDSGAVVISNLTEAHQVLEGTAVFRSIGATGTLMVEGGFTTSGTDHFELVMTAPVVVDTTIDNAINMTAEWGTASATNTITGQNAMLTKLLSP